MSTPRFSKRTLEFLKKASRQKRPDWLDRNRAEYEEVLLEPLQSFAAHLKKELAPIAPGYNFPQRGIGRLKRGANRSWDRGGPYRGWITYSAARPRKSRFEHNPNLFLLIHPADSDDPILSAGGLYMPSSKQTRAIRAAIAEDATAFKRLFASSAFKRSFPEGFSKEKISSRPVRGYDRDHPRMDWIRLQSFFVWRPYTMREFTSRTFAERVARDFRQALRLNALLDQAIQGRTPGMKAEAREKPASLSELLEDVKAPRWEMDY